jgi:hypothetical protein
MKKIKIPRTYPILGLEGDTTLRHLVYEYITFSKMAPVIKNFSTPLACDEEDNRYNSFYSLRQKLLDNVNEYINPLEHQISTIISKEIYKMISGDMFFRLDLMDKSDTPPLLMRILSTDYTDSVEVELISKSGNSDLIVEFSFQDGFDSDNFIYRCNFGEREYTILNPKHYFDKEGNKVFLNGYEYATIKDGEIIINQVSNDNDYPEEYYRDDIAPSKDLFDGQDIPSRFLD